MDKNQMISWKGLDLEEFSFDEITEHIDVSARSSGSGGGGSFANSGAVYWPMC